MRQAWGFGSNKPPAVPKGDYECQGWARRLTEIFGWTAKLFWKVNNRPYS
jgi:hypothetical protein